MMMAAVVAAMLAPAPAAQSASAFVERLYAGYRDPDYNPLARPERIFAPALVAAIREDERLSSDEVGFMDADPLCQCQDSSGLRASVEDVALRPRRAEAVARVRVDLGGPDRRELSLRLVRTRAGWRIADIATADEASLLGALRRFNRRRSAGRD